MDLKNIIIATFRGRKIYKQNNKIETKENFIICVGSVKNILLPFDNHRKTMLLDDIDTTHYKGFVINKRVDRKEHKILSKDWFKVDFHPVLTELSQLLCYKLLECQKKSTYSEMESNYHKINSDLTNYQTNSIKNKFLKAIETLKEVICCLLKKSLKREINIRMCTAYNVVLLCCAPDRYLRWMSNLTYRHAVFRCVSA